MTTKQRNHPDKPCGAKYCPHGNPRWIAQQVAHTAKLRRELKLIQQGVTPDTV